MKWTSTQPSSKCFKHKSAVQRLNGSGKFIFVNFLRYSLFPNLLRQIEIYRKVGYVGFIPTLF